MVARGSICPDEDTALAFVAGGLPTDAAEALEAHMATCGACRRLISELARSLQGSTAGPSAATTPWESGALDPEPVLFPGLMVADRYRVTEPLGAGAMGWVHAAFDLTLGRNVALKVVRSSASQVVHRDAMRRRIVREARALARVTHPNVIAVHEVGRFGEHVFIAMELVAGQTLERWLAQGVRTWREVVAAFEQAAAGLAAIHCAGLVHRDFKPSNVLVTDAGRVRIVDFGLARSTAIAEPSPPRVAARGLPEPEASALTRSGAWVGTPAYMAPEQFARGTVDARADQFAFCVALFEALHGLRPFGGSTFEELFASVQAGELRSPPRSDVPRWLDRVVSRGLERDPARRFASMDALCAKLRPAAVRRRRWVVGGGLAVSLAAGVGMLGSDEPSPCADPEARLVGAWDQARSEAVRQGMLGSGVPWAVATWTTAQTTLDRFAGRWVLAYQVACERAASPGPPDLSSLVALQCLGREASRLRAVTDVLATAEAEAMTRAGMLLTSLADPEDCLGPATSTMPHRPRDPRDAAEFDELAAAIAQVEVLRDLGDFAEGLRVAEDLPARAARIGSRGLEAEAWLWLGNLQDADARDGSEAFAQALWAAEAADRTPLAATAALALAGSETTAGNFDVARRWIEVGEALVERVGSDLTLQARVARVRGQLLHDQGQYAAALPELRQTVRIVRELYGDEDARLAPRLDDLGEVLRELGEYEAALASHGEALRVFETQVGEEHPWVATSLNKAAAVLTQQGRYEEALAHHERALAIRTGAFGDQHYAVAVSMANLGNCLIGLGRAPEAVDVLQRAVVITEATAADIQLAAPLLALAGAERMSGDIAAAEQTYARAVAQMRTSLGPDHVHVGVALANWAAAAFDNGQFERAAALAEEALQIETAGLGPDHPRTAFPLTMLGRAKLQLGEFEAAGAALQRSLEVGADRDPVDRAETRFALAEARWALGDRATARALAEQAAAEFEQGSRGLEGAHEVRTWIKRHS